MTRTTDEWEALLDGTDPAPWKLQGTGRFPLSPSGLWSVDIVSHSDKGTVPNNAQLAITAPESVAEVVRLRRAFEEFLGELNDDLAHEGIEDYSDIDDAWPSMQEYGELTVKLAHRNILTRILERHTDG